MRSWPTEDESIRQLDIGLPGLPPVIPSKPMFSVLDTRDVATVQMKLSEYSNALEHTAQLNFDAGQTRGHCDLINLLTSFWAGELPEEAFVLDKIPPTIQGRFKNLLNRLRCAE